MSFGSIQSLLRDKDGQPQNARRRGLLSAPQPLVSAGQNEHLFA